MARRKTLTDAMIASLAGRAKTYMVPDPELPNHYVRVQPTGSKKFVAVGRSPSAKQVWITIAPTTLYSIAEAREKARAAIRAVREGQSREGPEAFETVAETWWKRHVQAKGL